jgi:signal transduction histidine kinase
MEELRELVLDAWESRVRAEIPAARTLAQPVVTDTFPALYDNLVEALTPDYPRTSAGAATPSVSLEHGGERARLTTYDAQSVIHEYQLLRLTIFDILKQHQVGISGQERQIIDSAIDASIREGVTAFALAQSAFREQFMTALAHDLRNPLANAKMAGQLILRTDDPDKIKNFAGKICDNLERMDEMLRELLDTALFEHGERLTIHASNFDMRELIEEVCAQFEVLHGPRFDLKAASVTGWWGREPIQRALDNLIGNALKYGDPDGRITVSCVAGRGRVMVSVHNEGAAIPPDQLESVFQVFRRAKAAKDGDTTGWGIGLPFVRSVVESHGGSLDVDSDPERGTTFLMDIPVDARPFEHAPVLERR